MNQFTPHTIGYKWTTQQKLTKPRRNSEAAEHVAL